MVIAVLLAYAKFEKNLLIWWRIRSIFVMFVIGTICRASEGFKIGVLKNALDKSGSKIQIQF